MNSLGGSSHYLHAQSGSANTSSHRLTAATATGTTSMEMIPAADGTIVTTSTAASTIFSNPPMLPLIASDHKFITSTLEVLEAINYAQNPAIRANLIDALKCWLSHIDEVLKKYDEYNANWDRIASHSTEVSFPLATTPDAQHLDPRRLYVELKQLEVDMSFHDQFSSLPLLACIRVLKQIKEAAPLLANLDAQLDRLKGLQGQIITDINLLETLAEYLYLYAPAKPRSPVWPAEIGVIDPKLLPEAIRNTFETKVEALKQSSTALVVAAPTSGNSVHSSTVVKPPRTMAYSDVWSIADVGDMIAPLFSSLRALWVCSERFGAKAGKAKRFSSLTRFIINRVELSVHSECWDAIYRVIDCALPANITKVKATIVHAQEAIVALQEAFYSLKVHQAECGPSSEGYHLVFNELNDTIIFANVEWQYRRLTYALQVVDNLRTNTSKIGSKLTDPFENTTINGDIMSRQYFPDPRFDVCAKAILHHEAPDPDAIIANIMNKETERQLMLRAREPKYPIALITTHMTIVCNFSPPTVTIVGGPLTQTALDTMQARLPLCCANKIPDAKHSASGKLEVTFVKIPNPTNQHVYRLVIPEQYCETSVHVTAFVHTILVAISNEDVFWDLRGTHAMIDPDAGETHYFVFKKEPLRFSALQTPASKELAVARAQLAELEAERSISDAQTSQ